MGTLGHRRLYAVLGFYGYSIRLSNTSASSLAADPDICKSAATTTLLLQVCQGYSTATNDLAVHIRPVFEYNYQNSMAKACG